MKLSNPPAKQSLVTRLKRIEGQVRGVQAMVNDERECREVLQQLASIRAAVQSASLAFIEEYASNCLLGDEGGDRASREVLLKDLISVIGKAG